MTPSRQRRLLPVAVLSCWLAGCGALTSYPGPTSLSGSLPAQGPIIPDATLNLSNAVQIPLDKLVTWGLYAGAAYLILDPLAPNWEVEQAAFPDAHYHFSLKMKRFYAGGAGESRMVFHQRAKELMRQGGYDGYQVLEYSEGMESSVLGSQRVSQGVIRLTRK
ncbi:MAG: hypothetical protein M0Q22_05460 [Sulfuritalea sp.]|jgi:hypothetical protein|nr:hypothetical protein [Sulfuritalea sp.]